ncbi:MAG TPA: NYN domain-containing protein [Bacillota bacterium]|nr:NYN domain-containing protein [Bacillota bacterium]
MKRVMVFIDGSNFYHGLRANVGKTSVDFAKFSKMVCGPDRDLIRTYYYNVPLNKEDDGERYKKQQNFLEQLYETPLLTVSLGRLERRGATYVEKGIDVNIAVDMLTLAFYNSYDVGILVSGDADYVKMVEEVKRLGKHVEVAYFAVGQSFHLRNVADKMIVLDDNLLKDCWVY